MQYNGLIHIHELLLVRTYLNVANETQRGGSMVSNSERSDWSTGCKNYSCKLL